MPGGFEYDDLLFNFSQMAGIYRVALSLQGFSSRCGGDYSMHARESLSLSIVAYVLLLSVHNS